MPGIFRSLGPSSVNEFTVILNKSSVCWLIHIASCSPLPPCPFWTWRPSPSCQCSLLSATEWRDEMYSSHWKLVVKIRVHITFNKKRSSVCAVLSLMSTLQWVLYINSVKQTIHHPENSQVSPVCSSLTSCKAEATDSLITYTCVKTQWKIAPLLTA